MNNETSINIKKKKKYEIDMCSGNLFWKIIIFAIPVAFMGILQLFYSAADLIIVSRFSGDENAIGAVGSTSTLITLCVNLFIGFSVGTNALCAKYLGSNQKDKIESVVHTSLLLSFILGVILSIIGVVFCKDLLALMNNHDPLSIKYLQIYFLGMPFNLVYIFAASVLRSAGDTKRPLYYLLISGLVNVILNFVLVYFFNMSVAGVAIATVISQIISAAFIMITLIKTNEVYKFSFKKCFITGKDLKDIIKIGLPAGIQSSIFSLANVIIQTAVNGFGEIAKNGNAAASSIEDFVYTAMNAIYLAALAFISQNYGAKNKTNIKKVTLYSLIIVSFIAIISGGSIFLFGKEIISIYTQDPQSIEVGYIRLHYLCLPYFLCGLMDVMEGVLRGLGRSTTPMVSAILGVCGVRLLWIFIVFYPAVNFNDISYLNLLYISYPLSWIVTLSIHLITYFIISRKVFKSFEVQNLINI